METRGNPFGLRPVQIWVPDTRRPDFKEECRRQSRLHPQVGGKKELAGRTDIEIEISNQCARLIANAIIYYNSAILSHLLTKCEASGNTKAVALITLMSPAAWRHILLNGHYTFQSGGKLIDLDALLAGLDLG